jgi:hypothetical protein
VSPTDVTAARDVASFAALSLARLIQFEQPVTGLNPGRPIRQRGRPAALRHTADRPIADKSPGEVT